MPELNRVIELESRGLRLRKIHGSIEVHDGEQTLEHIPTDTLEAVIMREGTSATVDAINAIHEAGGCIIFCDAKGMPKTMLVPFDGHHIQAQRIQLQIAISLPMKKRFWQHIIRAKIEAQSDFLKSVRESHSLIKFIGQVQSGDPKNIEAQAARVYWQELFGSTFQRGRFTDPINARLNYGYAIIRSAMARAIVVKGLHPSLGLHHCDARNAMALVDDLIEPYRPLVDTVVYQLKPYKDMLDQTSKKALVGIPSSDLMTSFGRSPVKSCMLRTAGSLVTSLIEQKDQLWYPESFAMLC